MPKRQKLQLHQFEVNSLNVIDKKLFIYSWPAKLVQFLEQKKDGFNLHYAVKNLSEAIGLTIDEVIYARNKPWKELKVESDYFWLFALNEVNTDILKARISEWLLANKLNELSFDDITFDDPMVISTKGIFEKKFMFDLYGLLPQLYNFEFCKLPLEMESINEQLEFYPVVDTENESTAISRTFECLDRKKDVERFSYAITFKIVSNCEYPDKIFLNVYTGVKVWLCRSLFDYNKKINYIKKDQGHSVYVYKENEYIGNAKKKFVRLMYGRGDGMSYTYKNYSDRQLAKQLELDLLSAMNAPNDYNEFETPNDQIVLLTNNKRTERVKYGAGLPERLDVFKIVSERFPELELRDRLIAVKSETKLTVSKKKALKDIERFNDSQDDLEFINVEKDNFFHQHPPVYIPRGEQVIFEIYTENSKLIDAAIEFSKEILSLNMPMDKYTYRSCDGYEVVFKPRNGMISRGLSKEEQKDKKLRKREVIDELKTDHYVTEHVLSLIDIDPFHTSDDEEIRKQDPKKTIRKAFKEKARVTQFINNFNPEEQVDKIRLVNAVYDLLSAAGFLDSNYIKYKFNEKILLGLSAVKNSNGKIIALSKIEDGQVLYKIYRLCDDKWYSIHEILPKLRFYDVNPILKSQTDKKHFHFWISKQLNQININSKECYFFFDASLRYRVWPFAMNGQLDLDKFRLVNGQQIKFIRVNTTDEVPEYNIFKNDSDTEGLNRYQGLFTKNNKVFYSVGARPENLQVNLKATRLTHTKKMIGKQRVVEFITLTDDHDENIWLATQCHALRKLNLTFDASTKYPLPIYLNNRFGEYLDVL